MFTDAAKNEAGAVPAICGLDSASDELTFISELGRSLLSSAHPETVARRVAEVLRGRVNAEMCAFAAMLDGAGLLSCAFDSDGEITSGFLDDAKFREWVGLLPTRSGGPEHDPKKLFLTGRPHRAEYVSPLYINGSVRGAIIVGFADIESADERVTKLIEAVTQMAAMSVNLSAHYEAALSDSISQAKEEHRKFTEAILDALPVSLYVVDKDYKIVTWNRHREIGEQGIPRELALGRDVFQVLAKYPEGRIRHEFERAFRTGRIERIEQQTVAEDGSTRHWMVSKIPMRSGETGEVTHVITVGEDVTMRVEAIHAVGRAEKLAAVGRLAAGVVHEINNPLATIAACAEALGQRVDEGVFSQSEEADDLGEYLGLIKSEAFRCKAITTGLLDFSRTRAGERHEIDVAEVLHSSAKLIAHQKRGDNITIEVDVPADLPHIHADGGQIQQAAIALGINAIDAMPAGGKVVLRAFTQLNSVVIEVEDSGVGIAVEDLSRIFEPFFTTKEVGKGTGLGLAVCYGIITEHGGRLSVRSNVGKGTVFSILLPLGAAAS